MSENKMSERRLAELSKKNLHRADLTWQVLIGANFGRARLSYANRRSDILFSESPPSTRKSPNAPGPYP